MRPLPLLLACAAAVMPAAAQPTAAPAVAAPSPAALAGSLAERLRAGVTAPFDSVFPEPDARQLLRWAAEYRWPVRDVAARVVHAGDRRALLALAARPEVGNSGHETALGQMVTGLYEAERAADGWRLARRVPIATANRIDAQSVGVSLRPGEGLHVADTLTLHVADRHGFWAYLNHAAYLEHAALDGRPVAPWRGAGLLHVPAAPGTHRLVLHYRLDGARDGATNGNFSRFDADFGHARSQYQWLPTFDVRNGRDRADVRLTVDAPARVRVVTDLPQRDTVVGATRVVRARADRPVSSVGLYYDVAWRAGAIPLGAMRADLLLGDDFRPARAVVESTLARAHAVLADRYGEPPARHLALVQLRGASNTGWHFRSNDAIGAGRVGGALSSGAPAPQHYLGHELAHNWTSPVGPGTLFLVEGWATFAESLLLRDAYGPAVEALFWERQRASYLLDGFEGKESLLGDAFNGGVSYAKGAWVLRMLRGWLGEDAFDRGMRTYVAIPAGRPTGLPEFFAAMRAASGRDVAGFLRPWLAERTLPELEARLEPGRLIVAQRGPRFRLPLAVDLITDQGVVRRRLEVAQREDTLALDGVAARDVRIDPERALLLHRRLGEVVRFELRAPEAKAVTLGGSFARRRFDAVRVDGGWRVELPLTEGRYTFDWRVDGTPRASDEPLGRVVRPVGPVPEGWPR